MQQRARFSYFMGGLDEGKEIIKEIKSLFWHLCPLKLLLHLCMSSQQSSADSALRTNDGHSGRRVLLVNTTVTDPRLHAKWPRKVRPTIPTTNASASHLKHIHVHRTRSKGSQFCIFCTTENNPAQLLVTDAYLTAEWARPRQVWSSCPPIQRPPQNPLPRAQQWRGQCASGTTRGRISPCPNFATGQRISDLRLGPVYAFRWIVGWCIPCLRVRLCAIALRSTTELAPSRA
jgi:hypothetical protein